MDTTPRTYADSIVIRATADDLYALLSDVTRTGEWSATCQECWWDEGDGPRVGAWFTGRNSVPGRTWETRSQVIAAEPGREFAWAVGQDYVRWNYRIDGADTPGAVRLTQSWEFTTAGLEYFIHKFGDAAPQEIDARTQAAHEAIPESLATIKRIAEGG